MNAAVVLPLPGADLRPPAPAPRPDAGLSSDAIRFQLASILRSEGFARAQRMRRFLTFVVEECLAGRSGQVCEYTVGVAVFGRGESFEPALDPIVRNDARRLRQKLLEYYQSSRRKGGDEIVIDMPKGSYVPVFKRASRSSKSGHEYRLTITLTRISDGAEIWTTHHEY